MNIQHKLCIPLPELIAFLRKIQASGDLVYKVVAAFDLKLVDSYHPVNEPFPVAQKELIYCERHGAGFFHIKYLSVKEGYSVVVDRFYRATIVTLPDIRDGWYIDKSIGSVLDVFDNFVNALEVRDGYNCKPYDF